MKLNSRESLHTGSELIQEFGSWSEVRRRSLPNKHGVLILQVDRKAGGSEDRKPAPKPVRHG